MRLRGPLPDKRCHTFVTQAPPLELPPYLSCVHLRPGLWGGLPFPLLVGPLVRVPPCPVKPDCANSEGQLAQGTWLTLTQKTQD